MGTARAMEMGPVEGAMSSLSICIAGIMTVAGATFFSSLLQNFTKKAKAYRTFIRGTLFKFPCLEKYLHQFFLFNKDLNPNRRGLHRG